MLPDLETQAAIFQPPSGTGVWTIDVDDVDAEYQRITAMGIPMEVELRDNRGRSPFCIG